MKITWDGPDRIVKGLGAVTKGDVRETDTTTGKNLIRQGMAVLYRVKFKKKKSEVK